MTEGLTLTAKKFMKSFQPLSSETTVSSVSPLYFSATQGRRLQCFILPYKNSSDYNKSKKCVTLLPCARMCDRGSARRARGLKTGEKGTPDNNNRTVNQPLQKDWNVVVDKKFIAKIHIYISPLMTCRTHIPQT